MAIVFSALDEDGSEHSGARRGQHPYFPYFPDPKRSRRKTKEIGMLPPFALSFLVRAEGQMHSKFRRAFVRASVAAAMAIALTQVAWAQGPAAQPATPLPLDASHVEAFTDGAVLSAMHKDHIAGVCVAIVKGHDVLLAKGYGLAAPGKPADADTLCRVGSISKTGTWIALMQLVEQGKIKLDDPINAHLPPDLQIPDEGFSQPILVRNLMSHNAGFEDSIMGHIFPVDPNK